MKIQEKDSVFINCPFDEKFNPLFIAMVSALTLLKLTPRSVLEIPRNRHRLDRLVNLIRHCPISIHDLSRVQLDLETPRCPRFNMPFELGMAVSFAKLNKNRHSFYLFEERRFRLQKTLSDLNGYDPYIHNGNSVGVIGSILEIFVKRNSHLTPDHFGHAHSVLAKFMKDSGVDVFTAYGFKKMVGAGESIRINLVGRF
jgi:hypothetical protein